MKKFLFAIIIMKIPIAVSAQFLIRYADPSSSDVAFSALTKYGTDFLAIGNQGNEILAVAFNASGTVTGSNTITLIDNLKTPVCLSVITDYDGMQVISGYRGVVGDVSTYSAFIMRYDFANNVVLWAKSLQVSGEFGSTFDKILETNLSGPYLVCGYTTHPDTNQEGIICSVDRNDGTINVVNDMNLNESAEGYTSFVSFKKGVFTIGRYNLEGNGFDRMRSCISKITTSGVELFSKAYIRNASQTARMYGVDLVVLNNILYSVTTGDGAGIATNKELYLSKIKKNGTLLFTKKIDFTGTASDGKTQSIRTYASDLIVYGNKYSSTSPNTLGNAFLMRINSSGNLVWAKSYPFTFHQGATGVNSMLVSGTSILAVGRRLDPATNHYEGCILSVGAVSGDLHGCDVEEAVTITTEPNVTVGLNLTDVNNDDIVSSSSSATGTAAGTISDDCSNIAGED